MKLTKKLEQEILKAYNDIWDAYLRGDMRTFASILDENCYIIGSAAGEVFSNKKAAVKYYKFTAEQITGKAQFRNRKINVMPADKGFMVNEGSDFYLLIDDHWTFYGPARISSLFHKKNNKWKVVHQHGSFPDSKTEEGEQVNTDKIKAENIQLRDAVKRRTEELENKNRELEIETALERVRAVAMAMRKPEDLSGTGEIFFTEFKSLGFAALRNTEIIIISDAKETLTSYYYSDYGVTGIVEVDYKSNPKVQSWVNQLKKANDAFAEVVITEKEIKAWRKYREEVGHLPDPKLNKAKAVYYYSYSIGMGGLSISTFKPASNEQIKILERFRNVFNLSYQRYIDIAKAEAQARVAEIELALERVRAKTMAMQKPSEFVDVITVIGDQFVRLGYDIEWANFGANGHDVSNGIDVWNFAVIPGLYQAAERLYIPYIDHPVFSIAAAGLDKYQRTGEDFFVIDLDKKEKDRWMDHMYTKSVFKEMPDEFKKIQYNKPGYTSSIIVLKDSWLSIGKFDPKHFTEEQNAILRRFANAFGQAYTRFLDLQKAEAQARESDIELSLERVRAKTMAMQKPSEFVDIINIIGEQFVHLGFDIDWVNFGANGFTISDGIDIWNFAVIPGASPVSARVFIPYFDHPVFTTSAATINEFLNGGRDFIVVTLDKQTKDLWLDHLFTETVFKDVPEEYRAIQYAKPGYTTSNISIKDTWLSIGKFDTNAFTDEQHVILRRFANAFGQAYTRFLDLQKAEAQAREAQIEAGLERVRSRAMAMQSSEQLRELIGTVFTELTKLDIVLTRCLIMIYDPKSNDSVWWMANSEAPTQPIGLKVQYHEHPSYLAYVNAWKQKELKWTYTLEGNTKKEWDDFLFVETELSHLPDFVIAGMKAPDRVYLNASFNSFGNLTLATLEPLSDEHFDIMLRFAKVFDLTYTRFNDLKQAEAQAREARIETALERVRARTMAMQKSDELPETTFLLFQQLKDLGETAAQLSIGIIKEEEGYVELSATVHGNQLLQTYHVPKDEPYVMRKAVKAWKEKERSLTVQIEGQELKDYNNWRNSVLETKINFPEDRWIVNIVFFSKGMLSFSSDRQIPKETLQLLERFAAVFDLTYTRFLDLKKAEAQTREAQIELALERVRARTMAMHKSEELAETSQVLFHQLSELGGIPDRIAVGIADEASGVVNFWTTDQQGSHLDDSFSARLNERTTIAKTYQAWKEHKKSLVLDLHGEELKEWIKFAREEMGITVNDDQIKDRRVHSLAFFSHGWILATSHEPQSTETIQILERFASVFNLTYRRFLDLEKAEEQAREAQIEAALERVRAKAMAMHKSDDLNGAVTIMFEEFQKLNLNVLRCGIGILNKDSRTGMVWATSVSDNGPAVQISANESFDTHPLMMLIYESWKNQKDLDYVLRGPDLISYYRAMDSSELKLPKSQLSFSDDELQPQYYYAAMFNAGGLYSFRDKPFAAEDRKIMKRFASVVNLTYNRFLDLQKAEAQARDAQIEASLERVRSKTMAMHNSQDVADTVSAMFDELVKLGVQTLRCGVGILHEGYQMELWTARPGETGKVELIVGHLDMKLHPLLTGGYDSWKNKQENYSYELKGEDLIDYFNVINNYAGYAAKYDTTSLPSQMFHNEFNFNDGVLFSFSLNQLPSESVQIFKRFAGVFGQTYRRYLDLQKAESQARESQIEASLERVRSKTMAMHNSEDVGDTVATMFDELVKLGIETVRCGIGIMHDPNQMEVWTARKSENEKVELIIGRLDMTIHPLLQGMYNGWKDKNVTFSYELRDHDLVDYFTKLINSPDYHISYDIASLPQHQFHNDFYFPEGTIFSFSDEQLSTEASQIFKRFAGVFGQTYRRYLDLLKAEANAREAQIEAGLERVRARTMAMHSSEDVGAATATMFTELEKLGIQNLRGGITIIKAGDKQEVWSVTNLPDGKIIRSIGEFDMHLHALWRELLKAKLNNGDYNYYRLAGKDKEDYINILNATPNYLSQPIKDFPDVHVQSYFFGEGAIWTNSLQPHSEEDKQVMKRFASVFSLTFRRYQDLQKAEAQAREATIEASLERVRGKAMAMHSSKDLATTIGVFYHELEGLDLTPRRCGVGLISKETKMAEISTMNASADGEGIEMVGNLDLKTHPVLTSVYNNWLTRTEYHPVLRGHEIKEYYQIVRPQISFPDYPDDTVQYGYFFFFEEGGVYAWTEKELNEEELKIYRRFTSVLSLTYKRYKDLKDAEARTLAAIKDAALDRIRADIASMRTINDLDRITPLIWNELTILGIPFIRCGVFIMDEEQQLIHTFLSTPDGKAIAAFHLPYDTPGNLALVVANWKKSKKYIDHWDESEFKQFAEILMKQGALISAEQYLKTIPKGGFYLHFLPFLQGMLYVGNTDQLKEEEIELIQHVADAFSTAYARYEDFNKLEAAKQQVENTLTDLKQAQTQLVQAEKMASLGELTAGIAHEIQNPLNFVNNFSEVSKELLDEMKTELETGNTEDAKEIADDVIQNLEKINHHGKRADAIVKSMLQHSRSSSGKKEPTDINGLADEYLRLAYHGLRAKDKTFNAKFETDLDDSIGKINIISQDIGRVLVNLINNAFYAVSERKKQETNGYEPTVEVLTKKIDDKIEIKVKDNGNGIPKKVLDKIFQPFFTTKPTGQGTGLGLSLAYDIITKGHGGELKVETKEGEGSEFIIQLPNHSSK
jgi:signal transduction histidine kinase